MTPHLAYDYEQIAPEHRRLVMDAALKIKLYGTMSVTAAALAGGRLIEVKARLPHGQWLAWLELELGLSEASARRWMQVHRFVAGLPSSLDDLSGIELQAMYLLAQEKTPPEIREAAYEAVAAGQRVTRAWLAHMMADGRPEPAKPARPLREDVRELQQQDTDAGEGEPEADGHALAAILRAVDPEADGPAIAATVPDRLAPAYAAQARRSAAWLLELADELDERGRRAA